MMLWQGKGGSNRNACPASVPTPSEPQPITFRSFARKGTSSGCGPGTCDPSSFIFRDAAFLNMKDDGSHVPGPHPELVPFLAKERNVIGWGSEGVGTDAGQAFRFDPPFPCHSIMHGSNKFGLASLTNLDQLPPKGSILITPPLKIVNGSGSPCRVLALVAA